MYNTRFKYGFKSRMKYIYLLCSDNQLEVRSWNVKMQHLNTIPIAPIEMEYDEILEQIGEKSVMILLYKEYS